MQVTSYAPGTPCWVDMGSPDIEGTKTFYTSLFGWTANEGGPETGGYVIFNQGDSPVAGAGPHMSEGQPTVWNSYFATDDAAATERKIESAGGKVLMNAMDVMDLGRMGLYTDSAGAVFGLWQAGTFIGAGMANEPNSLSWNELQVHDIDSAKEFYQKALGLSPQASDISGAEGYTEFQVAGRTVAGGMSTDRPEFPPNLPPNWMVFFAVADTDAIATNAAKLGAQVVVPPTDIAVGRFSVIIDPQGATFAVLTMSPDTPAPA
ncbi:MAG TPA: VOC family protein [Micromonosporaceae bacterium]|nr:VOC family protein [Micromonosporaceae bacterium]